MVSKDAEGTGGVDCDWYWGLGKLGAYCELLADPCACGDTTSWPYVGLYGEVTGWEYDPAAG